MQLNKDHVIITEAQSLEQMWILIAPLTVYVSNPGLSFSAPDVYYLTCHTAPAARVNRNKRLLLDKDYLVVVGWRTWNSPRSAGSLRKSSWRKHHRIS